MIHAEIASGGMASVHFARLLGPAGFGRTVAVKRAHPHLARDNDFALMFLDEARLASRIRHPNVVPTLDVLQTDGELLLVMEYVHGESLWKLARTASEQGERVPIAVAAAIVVDTLRGLHAAHEARDERGEPLHIVHRDVSPHNILVGVDGIARLVDFGIAKAEGRLHTTRDSSVKGKYAYMSPEHARGEAVSRLSDTYAAAIILWELLTGERLFAGRTEAETIHKALVSRVRRPSLLAPDIPFELDAILEKALSRDPAGRYATALEMALEIEACVPAVRASEVGGWVQRISGDSLRERERVVAALEAAEAHVVPEQVTVVPGAERGPRRSRAGWIVAASLVAAGMASAVTLVARRNPSAPAIPSGDLPVTPATTVAASAVPSPAPLVVVPSAPSADGTTIVAAVTIAVPPAPSGRPPKSTAPVRVVRSSHAGCDPPYSIDSAGRQIFKPECVR